MGYNLFNDINEYKKDIIQILNDINKINELVGILQDDLNKYLNNTCIQSAQNYLDSLVLKDQLSRIFTIKHLLRKYFIYNNYAVVNDKSNNFHYFKIENGIFLNDFNSMNGVTQDYLKQDKNTLAYIIKSLQETIKSFN